MARKAQVVTDNEDGVEDGGESLPLTTPSASHDDDGFLTPEKARATRAANLEGHVFMLHRTGGKALVRRLSLTDRAMVGHLPARLQRKVWEMVSENSKGTAALESDGSLNPAQALNNLKRAEAVADAYLVAGFIKPRVIFTEADRESPGDVLVEEIEVTDKQAYVLWCEGDEKEAANRVAGFPSRQDRDVPPRSTVTTATEAE